MQGVPAIAHVDTEAQQDHAGQGGAEEAAAAAVPYEVAADDDAWAPAGTRSGAVALAPAAV